MTLENKENKKIKKEIKLKNNNYSNKYFAYENMCLNAICLIGSNSLNSVFNHSHITFCFFNAACK